MKPERGKQKASKIMDVNFDELMKRLLSGGLTVLLIKIATAGLSYAMIVVLAWYMPAAEYGRFAFGISLAITVSVLPCFGLHVAVMRYWPEYMSKNQLDLARSFVAWASAFVLLGAGLCAVLFLFGALVFANDNPAYGSLYFGSIALLLMSMTISEQIASTLRADGAIGVALGPRDILWRVLIIVVCSLTAANDNQLSAEFVLLLAAACLFTICLLQAFYTARRLRISASDFRGKTLFRDWTATAWPIWGSSMIFALVQQFDVVLIGLFVSPEETGPYFAAIRTAGLMSLLLMAGNMVAAPLISKYYHAGDHDRLRRMCVIVITGIALPTLAMFVMLVLFGHWLLFLFDPSFVSAYSVLIILCFGYTIQALAGPVPYFLQMVGRQRGFFKITSRVYAVVIISQCLLVPLFGSLGAAIPNSIGAIAAAVWSVLYLRRQEGFDPSVIGLIWPPSKSNEAKATP